MSRVRLDEKSAASAFAWVMECDKCFHRDGTKYQGRSAQPNLYRFHLLGWAVGDKGDRCPNCVAVTPLPSNWVPYFTTQLLDEMREAAAATDRTRRRELLLDGLTADEIATLLPAEATHG